MMRGVAVLQVLEARKGRLTPEARAVARAERVAPEVVMEGLASGTAVIPRNRLRRGAAPCGIGRGLRTKVNANIGTSADRVNVRNELAKLRAAVGAGADAVMDLSTGGDLAAVRRRIISASGIPVGTVPVYQAAVARARAGSGIASMTEDEIFGAIEEHGADGVDFVTVHCGVTRAALGRLRSQGRVMDVVSRGGAFLVTWMIANDRENPLYRDFGRLIEIAKRFDMALSLGDAMRPGCVADSNDRAQFEELITLGELRAHALREGVQVMIEGPGHVPIHRIEENVRIQKEVCGGAPFYVLGPLVTDVAPGWDHVVCAIGGAVAGAAGADFLCYVTPAEHLGLPGPADVRDGVVTARIAAHAADLAKGVRGASDWDLAISRKRRSREWEGMLRLALDPGKARAIREASPPRTADACTMCGDYCAMKVVEKYLGKG
jgi:phosphomethylpyrimidine synthase